MIVPNQRPNAPKGRSLKSALNNQEQQQPIFTTIREDKGGGVSTLIITQTHIKMNIVSMTLNLTLTSYSLTQVLLLYIAN